jgi:outer membrane protein assembly factor BamB
MLALLANVAFAQVWVNRVESEFTDFDRSGDTLAFGTYQSYGQLSLDKGTRQWTTSLKDGQLGVRVTTDGKVTAVSIGDGPLLVADAVNGKPKWSIPHKGYASPLALGDGAVYAEATPNRLAAFDLLTHKARWTTDIEDSPKTDAQVAIRPVRLGPDLFVGSRGGSILCLDPADGTVRWRVTPSDSPVQGIVADDERVYACDGRGFIYAIGRRTGTVVWHYDVGNAIAGAPVLQDGRIVVVSSGGFILSVNALSGGYLWRFEFSRDQDFSVSGPVVDKATVMFSRRDGVVAVDAVGRPTWIGTSAFSASFRPPDPYRGDYLFFDAHAVFRLRTQ